jgi:CRP/FNR family transcriptional regulator, anaerobic regulatory protein
VLFTAGDAADACATLMRGVMKVATCDADGSEHILALIHPAGFAGELFAPFVGHDVVALTECEICVFSRSQFEQALERYPELCSALLKRTQADLYDSRQMLALIGRHSAAAKVAGLLLALGHAVSRSPCHPAQQFELPLTRTAMARLLGLTVETVSRQLTGLEREGIVWRDGLRRIELRDPARLAEIAGVESSAA